MNTPDFDPRRFYDRFPRFLETTGTQSTADRLNARYDVLIHQNRDLLAGATVLDLASHDGLFSFAALMTGAERVIGIEQQPAMTQRAHENMECYGMSPSRYSFIVGNLFDLIDRIEDCDVVFCFGIFYHVNDHVALLSEIAELAPRTMILDTNVSKLGGSVIELRSTLTGGEPPPGGPFEGYPTKGALDVMLSSFGWTSEYFDWERSGYADAEQMLDYRTAQRVSAVVDCKRLSLSADTLERAVEEVFRRQRTQRRAWQWPVIKEVAPEFDMTPQALAVWVRKAERDAVGSLSGPASGQG